MSCNHIHKNNIDFDAKVWSLSVPISERGKSKLSLEGVLTHYGWCQFSSWGDGVGSIRCFWTAQQHGVLQVGVSLNVTHLEIHGVEQWTFQTGQASIKWGVSSSPSLVEEHTACIYSNPNEFLSFVFSVRISSIRWPFPACCLSFRLWYLFCRLQINPRLGHFAFS